MLSNLFFVNAITQTHVGSGSGLGLIDNPIIRHRRTSFPYIPSSSFKGVLKEFYRSCSTTPQDLALVFGPESDKGAEHASGLGILDLEILFFPVRSLKGVFAWITCPAVLKEFQYRLAMLNHTFIELNKFLNNTAIVNMSNNAMTGLIPLSNSDIVYDKEQDAKIHVINLEEYCIKTTVCDELGSFLNKIKTFWNGNNVSSLFAKNTIVVPDEMFCYYINHATTVVPNIKIDENTGVTKEGSLRYTEYLPELCVFYSAFTYQKIGNDSAIDIQNKFLALNNNQLPSILQVGGHATLGKGLVALNLFNNPQTEIPS